MVIYSFLNSYDKKMEDLEDATQKELEKMQADFDKQLAANEAEVKRYERIGKTSNKFVKILMKFFLKKFYFKFFR